MGYRVLNIGKFPSGLTETIGVTKHTMTFNSVICEKMGILPDSKVSVLVNDAGFLAINVLDKDSPTGRKLCKSDSTSRYLVCASLLRHLTPGRYHITGRDGAFWITDIKYNE